MSVVTLHTVLKDYPHTEALKQGRVSSPDVRFAFDAVQPVYKAFAPMVREAAYDLSELAIVTALQAIAFGRPIVLLPAVVASRFQRKCLVSWGPRGAVDPERLAGKRIAVRAYTQTTGMWVRSHLAEDFGLDNASVTWVTQDAAHVQEYIDPAYVEHVAPGIALTDMLADGSVDAAIFGNDLPEGDDFVPVIDHARDRDLAWWKRHAFMPINHMVAASAACVERHPAAIRAAYGLLCESAGQTVAAAGPRPWRFGFREVEGPLAFTIDTCMDQGLLPRRLTVDEVFAPARRVLGSDAA